MQLSQLRYFLKVVELGGINAAARELSVSQPAITTAIRSLEQELGCSLFNRVKQRMVLTEQGSLFRSRVYPAVAALDAAVEEVQELDARKHQVRLGMPAMIGLLYLPKLLGDFRRACPDVEIRLVEANTRELRTFLDNKRIDMALMIGESPYSQGLGRATLLRTSYSFFVGEGHALARETMVPAEVVADQPLILFDEGLFLNQYITNAFRRNGLFPHVAFASSQINAIKQYVGVAQACTFLIRECVGEDDPLVEVPTEITPPVSIVATWDKEQIMGDAAKQLLRFLKQIDQTK